VGRGRAGGICDDKQQLCFALALWNERDPILKERLYGLTNSEANHGEDVKEYYFYLDSTPTQSYMKYLYKYPQREYPYRDLIETNRRRSREEFEYELLDTGIFDDDRYFDVFVEYAKEGPEDVLIRITVHNRGPEAARLRVLPTLWFRNTWSWEEDDPKPSLREGGPGAIAASHHELGEYCLYCDGGPELLFTENDSNVQRLWGQPNASPYVKDAFHAYIISAQGDAVNPAKVGTKAAVHYALEVPGGGSRTVRLRLANSGVHPQRLLWASTGTKDLQASNYLYVKALAAPNTVNTMPETTLLKFGEHGELGRILSSGGGESDEFVYTLQLLGIDMDVLAAQLQKEGAESFVKSWDEMMDVVAKKAQTFK
jgi:hypothetical protein